MYNKCIKCPPLGGAPRNAQPIVSNARTDAPADPSSLDAVLAHAVRIGASDVLLIADVPVTMRVNGLRSHSAGPPLSAEATRNLLLPLMTQAQNQELQRTKSVDLSFGREGIGRFRANVHFQRGTIAGSVRLLPDKMPTLESLHLPPVLRRLAEARQGLVLVTGPTGCGKSSTLAALVDLINSTRHDHVVTIEDPIEYVHFNRKSIIEQIEVGPYANNDAPDFATSLRSILRQNPDVISGRAKCADLPETIATVLTAAETGHLVVLSTLHNERYLVWPFREYWIHFLRVISCRSASSCRSPCWLWSRSNWCRARLAAATRSSNCS